MLLAFHLVTGKVLAGDAFVIGVAPHTSARVILEMYQPLRLHLEKALGTSVEVVTAPDFSEFARRGLDQAYDLAITTGHQARLFQADANYIPLLTYKANFMAVVLVSAKGPIRKPGDLQEKNVLGLSPTSLVTLWGLHWLADNGLGSASVTYVSASDSVATMVIAGKADAGFVSLPNFQKLTPEIQGGLRILARSKAMAGRVYLLNRRRAAQQKQVDAALWAFAKTPEGLRYFETSRLEGYRKLGPKELGSMEPYAEEVRKELGRGRK